MSDERVDEQAINEPLTVAIATYNRPAELKLLLDRLNQLQAPANGLCWIETLVIDNSGDGNGEPIVRTQAARSARPIRYIHEPRPGISAARNAAIAAAAEGYVAFIDDDETPEVDWLVELALARSRHREACAIMGPVRYCFEGTAPRWLNDSKIFEVIELVAGRPPEYLATGNLLLDTRLCQDLGEMFDERFGLTGGEDHHLGLRLAREGFVIGSAPNAIVTETVPASRQTKRWARTRLLRKGGSLAATEVSLADAPHATRFRHVVHGAARACCGLLLTLAGVMRPSTTPWVGLRHVYLGAGQIKASCGAPTVEYART